MRRSAQAAQEQLGVGLGGAQVGEQGFDGVADGLLGELFAQVDHFEKLVGVIESVVVAGAGLRDVDGGEDAALGEFVMPYRTVREAEHAEALLLDFLRATYRAGAETGGWPQVDASA